MFGDFEFGAGEFGGAQVAPAPPVPTPTTFQRLVVECKTNQCAGVGADSAVYSIESPPAVIAAAVCHTNDCAGVASDSESYSLQDALYFNGTPVTVVVTCPPGATTCTPGEPVVVTYPPEVFVLPDVPIIPGQPIVLCLNGCQRQVCRTLPAGSSPALINAAVAAIIQEVATQQAICDLLPPTFPYAATITLGDLKTYACLGGPYDNFIQATSSPPTPVVFNYTGTLPPGITLFAVNNTQAFFYGTPTTAGTYSFTVTATGLNGVIATRTYTITVLGISTTSPLDPAIIDEIYSMPLVATGMSGTLLWGIVNGTLPIGLTLNTATGEIAGIPTTLGSSTFTVFVQNASQQCAKTFTVVVEAAGGDCAIFQGIVWDAPQVIDNSPVGSSVVSAIGNQAQGSATFFGNGFGQSSSITGNLTYTGPEITCDVNIEVSLLEALVVAGGGGVTFTVTSDIDGLLLSASVGRNTVGGDPAAPPTANYNFPFTVPLSVGAILTFVFAVGIGGGSGPDDGGGSVTAVATIGT